MKGRQALCASACALVVALWSGLPSEFAFADSSAATECGSFEQYDSSEDALAQRLSCYNTELDALSLLIGSLLQEREKLTSLMDDANAPDIAQDNNTDYLNTIERLRVERSELSAQLHRQLIENQARLLDKEAEERLLRNYSRAYLAVADENAELVARTKSLNQRVAELEQANSSLTGDNNRLSSESATFKSTIADLSAKRTQLTADISKRDSFIKKLRTQLIANARQMQQLGNNVSSLEKDILSLRQDKANDTDNIRQLSENIKQTAAANGRREADYITQLDMLRSQLEQAEADKVSLSDAALASTRDSDKKLQARAAQIEALQQELDAFENTGIALKAQLEAADQLLAEQNESYARLNKDKGSLQSKADTLTGDVETLEKQLSDRRLALDTANAKVSERNTELKKISQELARTKLVLNVTDQALTSAKQETASLHAQAADREGQLQSLQEQSMKLQSELDSATGSMKQTEQKRALALAASDSLLNINSSLKERLTAAGLTLRNEELRGDQLQSKIDQLQQEKADFSARVDELLAQNSTLEGALNASMRENDSFASSLENIKSELSASNDRLSNQQSELQALVEEKESIVATLNKTQTDTEQLVRQISDNLKSQGHSGSVRVGIKQDHTIGLEIASSELFRVGSSRLSDEGGQLLQEIATALADTSQRRILIEGHSDNLPLGAKLAEVFKDNMGLSMARALSAANFLARNTALPAQQLSIAGAGATRPVASNDTEAGRQQNRRVEIMLLPLQADPSAGATQ